MKNKIIYIILLSILVAVVAYADFENFDFDVLGKQSQSIETCWQSVTPAAFRVYSSQTLAFGNTTTNKTHYGSVSWQNTGETTATGLAFNQFSSAFRVYSTDTPISLAGGANFKAKIAFTPTSVKSYYQSITYGNGTIGATATATGTGISGNPYITDFASNWAGTGVQDTSNPSGGVYSGWTTTLGANGANTGNAYVLTYSASTTATYLTKTSLTSKQHRQMVFDFKPSAVTGIGSLGYFNIASMDGAGGQIFILRIMASSGNITGFEFQYKDGTGATQTSVNTSFTFVAGNVYTFIINGNCSTTTSSGDGSYTVSINGIQKLTANSINTYNAATTKGEIGVLYAPLSLTNTITFDNFMLRYL